MFETTVALALGGVGLSLPAAIFLQPKLKRLLMPSVKQARVTDLMPFISLLDDGCTLVNKNSSYARTLRICGQDTSTLTTQEYEALVNAQHKLLLEIAKQGGHYKLVTVRTSLSLGVNTHQFDSRFVQTIFDKSIKNSESFSNQHHLTFSVFPEDKEYKDRVLDFLLRKKGDEQANLAVLDDFCELTAEILPFDTTRLSVTDANAHLLQYWAQLATGNEAPLIDAHHDLDKWLSNARLDFDYEHGLITQHTENGPRFIKAISLCHWDESSKGDIIKDITALPFSMACLQLGTGMNKANSESFLKDELKHRTSSKAQEEVQMALEMVGNDEVLMFEHQLTNFVMGSSVQEVDEGIRRVRQVMRQYHLSPVVETTAIKQVFLQLFPGFEEKIRPTYLLSSNTAHLLNFHTDEQGVLSSDWINKPLAYFKSASSLYGYSFHGDEQRHSAANCLFLAPAGVGKTTLLQYLAAMALQVPKLQIIIFDRLYGTKIFVHAAKSKHIDCSSGASNINIFCCEADTVNELFLVNFLLNLAGVINDEERNAYKPVLRQAVKQMLSLPLEQRIFSDFYDELIPKPHPLYQRLYSWGKGDFSHWISGYKTVNGEKQAFDALEFGKDRLVSIEMTTIIDSPELTPLCEYFMHRIIAQTKRSNIPCLVLIDELAQMIANPIIKKKVISFFQEIRKRRGSVTACMQDAKSIYGKNSTDTDRELSDTMLNNITTQVFFPNSSAKEDSFGIFDLKDREWSFIKGQHRAKHRLKRPVLIRKRSETKGNRSAIVDIDLSFLGKHLQLMNSGGDCVELFDKLYKPNDDTWMEDYLCKV